MPHRKDWRSCLFKLLESPLRIDVDCILRMLSLRVESISDFSRSCLKVLGDREREGAFHTMLNLCFKVCGAYSKSRLARIPSAERGSSKCIYAHTRTAALPNPFKLIVPQVTSELDKPGFLW